MTINEKEQRLLCTIKNHGKVAVAFSSGVDSTFLLKMCADALGKENVVAITACSLAFPQREQGEAEDFCKAEGIKQIEFTVNQLDIPAFCANPPDRCYICKTAIFTGICAIAKREGCDCVLEGSNLDDDSDYRPGMRAIKELGVLSPLRTAELTKAEIRELSKAHSLPTASKPSLACLATRIAYGEIITEDKLKKIDKAEQTLLSLDCKQVRVRMHGNSARIEVAKEQMPLILENAEQIEKAFSAIGFDFTSLDLNGYRQGSLNKMIGK